MAELTMRAARPTGRTRRPKTFNTDRICSYESCETRISRYNRSDRCHLHAPRHYPRLRGVVTAEG